MSSLFQIIRFFIASLKVFVSLAFFRGCLAAGLIFSGAPLLLAQGSGQGSSALDLPLEQGDPLAHLREIEGKKGELTLVLRYQGDEGDYLVFYGRRGEPLYLRYREDRFDFRTRQIAEKLLRGRVYHVTFRYPESGQPKGTLGLIRRVVPLKKGVYIGDELLLPESYRF